MSHHNVIEREARIEAMDWVSRYFEDIGDHADYATLTLRTGEWLEALLGERIGNVGIRAIVAALYGNTTPQIELAQRIDRDGWRAVLEESDGIADWPSIASQRESLYAYAIDGVVIAPLSDVSARQKHLEDLFAEAERFMCLLPPNWEPSRGNSWSISGTYASALARWKLDRGEPVTVADIARLGRLDEKTVLNALGKHLHPDHRGLIAADEARRWLMGRRPQKFRPSRWLDPNDDQKSRSPTHKAKDPDIVMVPIDANGDAFLPTLARPTRGAGGGRLGFRIGAKGEEITVHDYFEALRALKEMRPARWRRPNTEGNWGIVRGQPNWRIMRRAEIDDLLVAAGFPIARSEEA